jgi:hypothetical protein
MREPRYTVNDFISKTVPTFLLGVITTLLTLSLLASCTEPTQPKYTKKVTIIKIEKYREPNTLQEYEVKWKATMSDGKTIKFNQLPQLGDTIIYRYYSSKK